MYARGEVVALRSDRTARGHEQRGRRYAVVLQNDALVLSTLIVAPTSMGARAASFRPEIRIAGATTRVCVEQATAVDPVRLGESVGFVSLAAMHEIDAALRVVLSLE